MKNILMDYLFIAKNIVLKHIDVQNYKVFLFGSRAVGNVSKFSDLDIGIMGTKPLDPRTIFEIEHELEESLVPYKVDIVDFFNVDEAFKKMALKKIIEWS
jgi:predicted nucleotidyltransferase